MGLENKRTTLLPERGCMHANARIRMARDEARAEPFVSHKRYLPSAAGHFYIFTVIRIRAGCDTHRWPVIGPRVDK